MRNRIALVSQTPKTVLTTRDLALLWQETDRDALKAAIAYSVKRGDLVRLTRGVFAKGREYDPRELATSLYAPSYISFETALREAGVLFQHADTLFVAGPWSKAVTIGRTRIRFRRLKDAVLFNPSGIENRGTYSIASPERAFLDMLYLFPDCAFDNLRPIDWDRCSALVGLYRNARLAERLRRRRAHAR